MRPAGLLRLFSHTGRTTLQRPRDSSLRARHIRQVSPNSGNSTNPGILRRLFSASPRAQNGLPPTLKEIVEVSDEIADALATKKPIVALESTIYTHGAFDFDLELEAIVRRNGGIPAVIGVLDGVPKIGITPTEVERMIQEGAKKVSRRDLAYLVGKVSLLSPSLLSPVTISDTALHRT